MGNPLRVQQEPLVFWEVLYLDKHQGVLSHPFFFTVARLFKCQSVSRTLLVQDVKTSGPTTWQDHPGHFPTASSFKADSKGRGNAAWALVDFRQGRHPATQAPWSCVGVVGREAKCYEQNGLLRCYSIVPCSTVPSLYLHLNL